MRWIAEAIPVKIEMRLKGEVKFLSDFSFLLKYFANSEDGMFVILICTHEGERVLNSKADALEDSDKLREMLVKIVFGGSVERLMHYYYRTN